ncbi:hypothetical protein ACWC9T_16975 [Kitasatospora sp. NPDC001159]
MLLAACSGGGGTAAPSATSFGAALDQALGPVGTAFGKATSAKTAFDLQTALADLASDANRAARNVNAAAAPSDAAPGRVDLATALTTLATDTEAVRADITEHKVCAAGAGLAQFGAGPGLAGVSAALTKLTAAGYRTTFTVPQLPKPLAQPRTLANGTMVREAGKSGKGVLKVDNNSPADAVFTLAADGTSVASVYVAKGQQATIEGIADGPYGLSFTGGADWDPEAKQFTQHCAFAKFTDKRDVTSNQGGTVSLLGEDGNINPAAEWVVDNSAVQP